MVVSIPKLPTLDEIASDPCLAMRLPPRAIAALMAKCGAAQGAIAAALVLDSQGQYQLENSASDRNDFITLEAAAAILGRSKNWILRNRIKKSLPFVRQISGKTFMVSESSLRKWIESRPRRSEHLRTL